MVAKKTTKKTARAARKAAAPARTKKGTIVHATDKTFGSEVSGSPEPVLVDFSAAWCGPCRRLGKALPAIARDFAGQVKVVKVDVDESPRISAVFIDEGVPTLVLFRKGKPVAVDVGFATKTQTATWLRRALARKPEPKRARRPVCCGR